MNINKIFPVFLFLIFIFFSKCDTTETPPDNRKLTLAFEDASCAEVWIKLTTENLQLPAELNLTTTDTDGNLKSQILNLKTQDSLLYLDSLLPNNTYKLKASSIQNPVSSNELSVTTMDTTNHNFNWQKFTFGVGASSIFSDVAIIDENNIYAVGEIYLNDSIGQPDPTRYNLAIWNGSNWSIKRVPYYFQGQPYYNPIQTIFAFGINDIWFAGNGVIHWNGNQYNPISIPSSVWGPYQINKIWGILSNNIYIVGNNGKIAHYINGNWSVIESEIDLSIHDVNGFTNPFTGKPEILSVADDPNFLEEVQVIGINENNTTQLLDNTGLGIAISSIWFSPGIRYYIVGNGLYEKTYKDTSVWRDLNSNMNITTYFMESIRGNALNDILVTGAFGEVLHFNGIRWKSLKNSEITLNNGSYFRVTVKGNTVTAVGYDGNQAVVLIGYHQ